MNWNKKAIPEHVLQRTDALLRRSVCIRHQTYTMNESINEAQKTKESFGDIFCLRKYVEPWTFYFSRNGRYMRFKQSWFHTKYDGPYPRKFLTKNPCEEDSDSLLTLKDYLSVKQNGTKRYTAFEARDRASNYYPEDNFKQIPIEILAQAEDNLMRSVYLKTKIKQINFRLNSHPKGGDWSIIFPEMMLRAKLCTLHYKKNSYEYNTYIGKKESVLGPYPRIVPRFDSEDEEFIIDWLCQRHTTFEILRRGRQTPSNLMLSLEDGCFEF